MRRKILDFHPWETAGWPGGFLRSCITCGEEIEDSRPRCYKCNKAITQKEQKTKRLKEESGEIKKKLKNTTAPVTLPCKECKKPAAKNRNTYPSLDDGWGDYYDDIERVCHHNHPAVSITNK